MRVARVRSSQGFVTLTVLVALLGGLLGVVFVSPARTSVFRLLDGSAFVADTKNGALVHVNGRSGKPDLKVGVPGAGGARGMDVVQRNGYAYASVTLADGSKVLYRVGDIDGSQAKGSKSRKLKGGQRLVRGGDRAYLVDEAQGTVLPVDADSLSGLMKKPLSFKKGISVTAGDDGSLLVAERRSGKMFVVRGSSSDSGTDVGDPGDDLRLALVAGKAALVNGTAGRAYVVENGALGLQVDLPKGGRIAVPEETDRNELVVLQAAQSRLVLVNLDDGTARQVRVNGDDVSGAAPLATRWGLFLADAGKGAVVRVDPDTGASSPVVADDVELGKGENFQVFVKDDYLWLNTPGGSKATVIGPDGKAHQIDKYTDKIPTIDASEPTPTPESPPGGDPIPSPNPGSTGPAVPATPVIAPPPPPPTSPPVVAPTSAPPPLALVPSTPDRFTGQVGNAQVTLSWGIPADNGSPITGFDIGCKPDCGTGNGTTISVGPGVASQVVTGLKNGKKSAYNFTIIAKNAVGPSPQATAGPFSPTPDVPGKATNVVAQAKGDGTVALTWDAPEDSTMDPASYTITATSNSTDPTFTGVKTKVYTMASPAAGVGPTFVTQPDSLGYDDDATGDFTFTVQAVSATNVAGPASDPSVTPIDPYNKPSPINPSTATAVPGSKSVAVQWAKVAAKGRTVRYLLEESTSAISGPVSPTATVVPAPAGNTVVANRSRLTNGVTYYYRVTPDNAAGNAAAGWTKSAKPYGPVPAVTLTPNVSGSSVSFNWNTTDNGNGIQVVLVSGGSEIPVSGLSGTSQSFDIGYYKQMTIQAYAKDPVTGSKGPVATSPPATTGNNPARTARVYWGAGRAVGDPSYCSRPGCKTIMIEATGYRPNTRYAIEYISDAPPQLTYGVYQTGSFDTDSNGNFNNMPQRVDGLAAAFGYSGYSVWIRVVEDNFTTAGLPY